MESAQTKPRIRIGRTETDVINEMDFSHQRKTLTAVYPFYRPENSKTLQNLIRKKGHVEPTSSQVTSFVHEYFNSDEPQATAVKWIMNYGSFRGFTGILYLPQKKIAHFIDYPEFDKESVVDRDNLLERLDESYAQVPFEHFKREHVNWRDVAEHPYFVAFAGGKEGAEKLAELASKHSMQKASCWIPDISNLKEPIARVAALSSSLDGKWLCVISSNSGDYEGNYAFGMLEK